VSKIIKSHAKTEVWDDLRDKARKIPVYCPGGRRHRSGENLAQASIGNVGTSPLM